MARLLIALVPILLLGTTSAPVPGQEPNPSYYFPVQKDARWVYLWKAEGKKDEDRAEVVTEVSPGQDGARVVTVSWVAPNGQTWPSEKYEVSARGLMWKANLVGYGGYPSPPHFQMKQPQRTGQSWKLLPWDDTMLVDRGVERVRVPAGEFDAVRVDQMLREYPTAPAQTRWYAPGVGQVKLTTTGLDITLKSFMPGKDNGP